MADGDETVAGAERQTEFRVGDRVMRVRPFKGSKGVRALAILSRVGDRMPAVWESIAKFEEQYRERNFLTITRDQAEYRVVESQNTIAELEARLSAVPEDADPEERVALGQLIRAHERSKDDWARMLACPLRERAELRVPQSPSNELRGLAVFPVLWDIAEPEMTALLGLVLIDDDELRQARLDGRADEAIAELGARLLDELELDEVADLMMTALEASVERYQGRMGRLGKRAARLRETLTRSRVPSDSTTAGEDPLPADPDLGPDGRKTTLTVGSVETPSSDERQSWSTGSPGHTDGAPNGSSTESSGLTSYASAG